MKDFDKTQYEPVGYCIYCGNTNNLQREHIIPFGLSGTGVLPRSSCGECAKITGEFEQLVLRGPMWAVRVLRGLKSRRKHKDAPKAEPISVVIGGKEQVVELPINEYPIMLYFPIFSPPRHLTSLKSGDGIQILGTATVLFGPNPEEVLKKIGASKLTLKQNYQPVAFARMIAKIAYSMAFADRAIELLDGAPMVLPAILGKKNDIGRWVGTLDKPFEIHPGLLHRVLIQEDKENRLLLAEVQLFADSQSPSYSVVIGKLK